MTERRPDGAMTRTVAGARTTEAERAVKDAMRATWALGDYHRFAKELLWDLGAVLVRAGGVRAGQDVLDVACGTGNVALRAAELGARVLACDLTPEHFGAARREAAKLDVAIDWVEGDAERLPFPDAEFDVVLSSLGAMWAPDHRAVADELLRVCRPGGTIAVLTFAADGLLADFLAVFDGYATAPPSWAESPLLWGQEDHVRNLFGERVARLEATRGDYVERVAGGPEGYCRFYRETFGPVVATYAGLAGDPARTAELDARFQAFARRANRGEPGGAAELTFEYVLIVARPH